MSFIHLYKVVVDLTEMTGEVNLKPNLPLPFFIEDCSLYTVPILFKSHKVVYNIYLEGAVSQTLLIFQTKVSTFDKTQTKTYIKNLRQASFHVTRLFMFLN